MKPTDCFSLEIHEGLYSDWPSDQMSRLFYWGKPTDVKVPGFRLEAQFEMGDYYLLFTGLDCPWEDETYVHLLDSGFQILDTLHFGLHFRFWASSYGFHCFDRAEPIPGQKHKIRLLFAGDAADDWMITIKSDEEKAALEARNIKTNKVEKSKKWFSS